MSENQDQVLSGREIANNLVGPCLRDHIDEVLRLERGKSFTYSGPIGSDNRLFIKLTFARSVSDDVVVDVEAVFDGEKVLKATKSAESSSSSVETYVPGEWEKLVP